ncbi:hypothetical protein KC19_8G134600 [Ceratodon purpureus]|uniref:Uncharacterized protein n=1 Tax=Ceratodon purpureus TaxID=3225 RepID=A0A8T0H3Q1_CERPU|nr:hypothetical protein KC19_8G134600 [Ceratodon purpureus]
MNMQLLLHTIETLRANVCTGTWTDGMLGQVQDNESECFVCSYVRRNQITDAISSYIHSSTGGLVQHSLRKVENKA